MTAQAKIRITTEGAQALGVLKQMRTEFAAIGKDANKAADSAQAGWDAATKQIAADLDKGPAAQRALSSGGFAQSAEGARKLTDQLQAARGVAVQLLATLAGTEAVRKGAELVDTYSGLTARLKLVTNGQAEYKAALAASTGLSTKYQQSLEATSASLTKTYAAIKPLGGSIKQATDVTEALMAALKAGGATTQESAAATLQFAQALGKGVLNGDEFNSINEAAPGLLRALATGLGVPTAALKEMGAEGQLTTAKIVAGLSAALPQLQADAAAIPTTVGGAVQQVNNQLLLYVGTSEDAKAKSRLLIDGLLAIGDNIGPIVSGLTTLVTLIGVGYIGKLTAGGVAAVQFAIQQRVIAAAAASVATEMGIAAAATTTFTSALAGPVGLVVALGSLALGWIALGRAKNEAKSDNADDLRQERADVQAQLDALNARRRAGKVNALDGQDEARNLGNQLKALDTKLAELEQRKADALRMSGGSRGASTQEQLLDPATVAMYEKEFKTKDAIEKDFRTKRDAYTLAKDAEINLARSRGSLAYAEQLEAQKNQVLGKMDDARKKAIEALDKDTSVTRLAQAKDTYNKEADLQADALTRQAKANEEAWADGLVNYQAYLADRAKAEDGANAAELAKLRTQIAAQKRALSENQGQLGKAGTANERATAQDAIAKQVEAIAKLEAEVEKKQRDQVDAARARRREEAAIVDEIRRQRDEITAMLAQSTGTETADTVARGVRQKYEGQLKAALQNDQDPAPLLKLIDVETERARFQLLQRQFQEQRDALSVQEQAVQVDKDAGLIGEAEAERRVLKLREDSLKALRDQAAALSDQSDKLNQVAGKSQPKESGEAKNAQNEVKRLADLRTEFEKTAKSSGISAISTELSNILTGTKKVGTGLRDMVAGFAKSMLDLITQRLGAKLVDSLIGSASGGAGGGGWVSAVSSWAASFFHAGGVVNGGGGTRSFPASTWAMAPRYHSGGIGGLAPNEVPAVLLKGEEVLTEDDPRHIKNMSRQAGGVSVSNQVTINGAQGSGSEQQDAGSDLVNMVNATIDAWALKQSRPGGILSGA
jgi:tape measure domain-containing protein